MAPNSLSRLLKVCNGKTSLNLWHKSFIYPTHDQAGISNQRSMAHILGNTLIISIIISSCELLNNANRSISTVGFPKHDQPEDHWPCIAHLSAEDMLKSVVIEEKKLKHSLRVGADNPFGPKF